MTVVPLHGDYDGKASLLEEVAADDSVRAVLVITAHQDNNWKIRASAIHDNDLAYMAAILNYELMKRMGAP